MNRIDAVKRMEKLFLDAFSFKAHLTNGALSLLCLYSMYISKALKIETIKPFIVSNNIQ